jgi:hypothetical protein
VDIFNPEVAAIIDLQRAVEAAARPKQQPVTPNRKEELQRAKRKERHSDFLRWEQQQPERAQWTELEARSKWEQQRALFQRLFR